MSLRALAGDADAFRSIDTVIPLMIALAGIANPKPVTSRLLVFPLAATLYVAYALLLV